MRQIQVEYGCHTTQGDFIGLTVVELEISLRELLNLPATPSCYVDGILVEYKSSFVLERGAPVLFLRRIGRKSGTPEEIGRIADALEQIGSELNRISGQLDESLMIQQRLADEIAPERSIVGTRYVAERIGKSTRWITDLVRDGKIPKQCIVPQSGNGRYWRFYKKRIDRWIEEN